MSENELFLLLEQLDAVKVMQTSKYDVLQRLQEYFLKENVSKEDLTNMLILLKCGLQFRDSGAFEELKHVYKLLPQIREDTAALTCEIFYTILKMDKATNFEQWFHTILSNVADEVESWLIIRICDSILDTLIENGKIITVEMTHVHKILLNGCEGVIKHFLGITVPKLVKVDSEILKTVLEHIKQLKDDQKHKALNMLSFLSDLYLSEESNESPFTEKDFCDIIQKGLSSPDDSHRKTAMALAKKAVGSFIAKCLSQNTQHWRSYLLLIESLEEGKVLSLQTFETLKLFIDNKWLNIAYAIGLNHKNIKVKHPCIEHRLQMRIASTDEAKSLLLSLNDTELYSKPNQIVDKLRAALHNDQSFFNILVAIPTIPWAPVPLYYVASAVKAEPTAAFIDENKDVIIQALKDITEMHRSNNDNNNSNTAVTEHVHALVMRLATAMCQHFHWRDVFDILAKAKSNVEDEHYIKLVPGLINLQIEEREKKQFYEFIMSSADYIGPMISYFKLTKQDGILLDLTKRKIEEFRVAYSNHELVITDLVYFNLLSDFCAAITTFEIFEQITKKSGIFLQYLLELVSSTSNLTYDDPNTLDKAASFLASLLFEDLSEECQGILQKIYETAMSVITNERNNDMKQKVFSLHLLQNLCDSSIIETNGQNDLECLLTMNFAQIVQNCEDKQLIDSFYLAFGEIIFLFLEFKIEMNEIVFQHFIQYTKQNLYTGRMLNFWAVRVVTMNLDRLISTGFDISKYIHRIWSIMTDVKETDEMKSGISEFIELIMHDAVIDDPNFKEVLKFYFEKFKEMARSGDLEVLYYFVSKLKAKIARPNNEQLIEFLQELMMLTPFMDENERLTKEVEIKFDKEQSYNNIIYPRVTSMTIDEIHNHTVHVLLKIDDVEVHRRILNYIMKTVDEALLNMDRYEENSQEHRKVQIGVQHILFYALLQNRLTAETFDWCMKLLVEKQHLPSVRICLEWFLALDLVVKEQRLDSVAAAMLSSLPVTSQAMIMFMTLSHKMNDLNYGIIERPYRFAYTWEEYNIVMQFLLKQTMLPTYKLRVYSQVLAAKIYKCGTVHPDLQKYPMIIVESTLKECKNEEAYTKLEKHFFTNDFDVIGHLVPKFIYKILPSYFGMQIGWFGGLLKTSELEDYLERNESELFEKWKDEHYSDGSINKLKEMLPIGNDDI